MPDDRILVQPVVQPVVEDDRSSSRPLTIRLQRRASPCRTIAVTTVRDEPGSAPPQCKSGHKSRHWVRIEPGSDPHGSRPRCDEAPPSGVRCQNHRSGSMVALTKIPHLWLVSPRRGSRAPSMPWARSTPAPSWTTSASSSALGGQVGAPCPPGRHMHRRTRDERDPHTAAKVSPGRRAVGQPQRCASPHHQRAGDLRALRPHQGFPDWQPAGRAGRPPDPGNALRRAPGAPLMASAGKIHAQLHHPRGLHARGRGAGRSNRGPDQRRQPQCQRRPRLTVGAEVAPVSDARVLRPWRGASGPHHAGRAGCDCAAPGVGSGGARRLTW